MTVGDLKHLIIGVDLDGVCSDFYGRMREVAAEWFERSRRAWRQGVEKGIKVERELSSEKIWVTPVRIRADCLSFPTEAEIESLYPVESI